jgi:AcrR family transcriptional regulator
MKQRIDTKERLLDAAEEVFARAGYRAASLRAITARAAVNLAAVNYHFGSKRELVEAVFARRLAGMNQARVQGLSRVRAQAREAGRRPEARVLLAAFLEATLGHARRGAGERNFMTLVLRAYSDADHTVQRAFESYMEPAFSALQAAMSEALPGLPPGELWWRLQFTVGAMVRVQHLSLAAAEGAAVRHAPDAATVRRLVDFVHAGLTAPPAAPSPQPASAQGEPS